ncbi:hypothetical protein GGS26DRAFT_597955 [Hypomontagnella submonticulosa]|nr:hypothetical protein GGS26DRAFT_597955 [Hypomontagnella submonticulosa]
MAEFEFNPATAFPRSLKNFCNRFHPGQDERVERMIDLQIALSGGLVLSSKPPDVKISISESGESWMAYSDVITTQSNFFNKVLSCGMIESHTKEINMHELEAQSMDFVLTYMHEGWDSAVEAHFEDLKGEELSMIDNAGIILLADYLDMPLLGYEAYYRILLSLVGLVKKVGEVEKCIFNGFAHNGRDYYWCAMDGCAVDWSANNWHTCHWCALQKPFIAAAEVLKQSQTAVGSQISRNILRLLRRLQGEDFILDSLVIFDEIFKHDYEITQRELCW